MADDGRAKRIRFEVESRRQELPLPEGGGEDGGGPDLISRLPDEVLGDIISLLPTRDGARTQAISRRWRPLWRAAPLNLEVDRSLSTQERKRIIFTTKILSSHAGPGRRFSLRSFRLRDRFAKIDGWLSSRALTGLREIEFGYEYENFRLPPSALRFAPTLCIAEFAWCVFPSETVPELNFPHLKKLSLSHVTISEDTLHSLLSGCSVLDSLLLKDNVGIGRLRISSPTLRSFGFSAARLKSDANAMMFQELVINDAPCLERLLSLHPNVVPATICVMQAPKLEIVGMLSAGISKLVLGTTVFQEMIALKPTSSLRTVKVLALDTLGPNLDSVVDFLKCFPCVEKLYVTYSLEKTMKNARSYNSLDAIECLEVHLKKVVMNNYHGMKPDVDFAKFFVLNAKVLEEIDFEVSCSCNDKWMANQRRRLQVDKKASPGARFAFGQGYGNMSYPIFPNADPFEWSKLENFHRFARLLN